MTADFGEEVYIGCVDLVGCGASVVNAIIAPARRLELPVATPANVGLAVSTSTDKQKPLEPFEIKDCTSVSGHTVSLIGINVIDSDECSAIKVAHALIKMLRDAPKVKQVYLIGAAHLPMCQHSTVAVAAANGGHIPSALQSCKTVAAEAMLKNEMIASLHYWLSACAIPTVMCMVPSNRPAAGTGLPVRSVDAAACDVMGKALLDLVEAKVEQAVLGKTVFLGSVPNAGPQVDSLMYM